MAKIKGKLLAAAIALLGLSTAGAVTGTVAWFTAANTVSVSDMYVKAQAEEGIVISNQDKLVWKTSTTAKYSGGDAAYVPTSTADASAWFHGYADDANNGQSGEVIEAVTPEDNFTTPSLGTANDGIFLFNENGIGKNIYLLNKFYIKASGKEAIANQDIYVKEISATLDDTSASAATQQLSTALRVLIKETSGRSIIFAPVSAGGATPTLTYKVGALAAGATDNRTTTVTAIGSIGDNDTTKELSPTDGVTIPAYDNETPLEYSVYIYFEGEDAACKSANIQATMERLSVSFKLANKEHDAA